MSNVVIIEGSIAAGKTTLAKYLSKRLGFHLFEEPVRDNPYLKDFYKDPARYALKMQMWLLQQRAKTYEAALQYAKDRSQGVILDRSVWSDWVFAANSHADGLISAAGFEAYKARRAELLRGMPVPALCVYLDVRPEVCHDRILHLRAFDYEAGIQLSYLQGLEREYKLWLPSLEAQGTHLVRVDRNIFSPEAERQVLSQVRRLDALAAPARVAP